MWQNDPIFYTWFWLRSPEVQVEPELTRTHGPYSGQVVEKKTGQEDEYSSKCHTVDIAKWPDVL